MYEIVQDILDVKTLSQELATDADGAIATFSGIVRGINKGKKVLFLEYEAYPEMAVKMMERIGDEIKATWGLESLRIQHRVGRVNVGETSVVIVVTGVVNVRMDHATCWRECARASMKCTCKYEGHVQG